MNNKQKSSPFTLIELLVVVAIIAILASLLLPALTKARMKARIVNCVSQTKNISTGLLLYTDDYEAQLPTHRGRAIGESNYNSWQSTYWMWQMMREYSIGEKMFNCEANTHNEVSDGTAGWVTGVGKYDAWLMTNNSRTVYSLNGRLLTDDPSWTPPKGSGMGGKITRSDAPERTALMFEYSAPVYVDGASTINSKLLQFGASKNTMRDHIGNGITFGGLDGHVENLRYKQNEGFFILDGMTNLVNDNDWYYSSIWW